MSKEMDEDLFNYNKYPGVHVIALPDGSVQVGEKSFQLVENFKNGFDPVQLEHRYSDLFAKYDFIVGDWAHELLRLRGFYATDRNKVAADERIDHLADYLQEYCSYGCAYFVLRRDRKEGETDAEAFVSYAEDEKPLRQSKKRENREERERKGRRNREFSEMSTDRPAANKMREDKKREHNTPRHQAKDKKPKVGKKQPTKRPKFTIRNRVD